MQNKLKITAILLTLLFSVMPLTLIKANAMTFETIISSFGLYSNSQNAVLQGKVKYCIDGNGKAVQYSEYSVNSGIFYVPFISSSFDIHDFDTDLKVENCYGSRIGLSNEFTYDFYSSDLNGMSGTVYTLNTASESFTIDFTLLENQTYIYRLTNNGAEAVADRRHTYTVNNANPDIPYEIFILNGDCIGFESSADITKETVTIKEYIDRYFNEFKDYYSVGDNFIPTPDMFYALANQAAANNINYDFFDFFIDSFSELRLNAYKIEVEAPCIINYSMSVNVQENGKFTPAIYMTEVTATGKYPVDYTIELNGGLPYIIESSAEIKKQGEYIYTAQNVTDDFYFVFSSSEKLQSINGGNNKFETWQIVLFVLSGVVFCVAIVFEVISVISFIKSKKQGKRDK